MLKLTKLNLFIAVSLMAISFCLPSCGSNTTQSPIIGTFIGNALTTSTIPDTVVVTQGSSSTAFNLASVHYKITLIADSAITTNNTVTARIASQTVTLSGSTAAVTLTGSVVFSTNTLTISTSSTNYSAVTYSFQGNKQ